VYDTTVSGMPGARYSLAITQRGPGAAADHAAADDLLARVPITGWPPATGHTLAAGVAPHPLTEDELISCWADDQMVTMSDVRSGPIPAGPAMVSRASAADLP